MSKIELKQYCLQTILTIKQKIDGISNKPWNHSIKSQLREALAMTESLYKKVEQYGDDRPAELQDIYTNVQKSIKLMKNASETKNTTLMSSQDQNHILESTFIFNGVPVAPNTIGKKDYPPKKMFGTTRKYF